MVKGIFKTKRGLAETSLEELSKQTGRTAPPTSPLEASVIGGNEDASKMSGTPQQKTSALRQAIRGGGEGAQDLQTTLRRQDVRRQATAEEEKKREAMGKLQNLGSLDSRVDAIVDAKMKEGLDATKEMDLEYADDVTDEEKVLLDRIKANPEDTAAVVELNELRGITDPAQMMSADELMSMFDPTKGLAEALSTSISDSIQTGALDFADMGFTGGAGEVAGLLGISEDELGNMSIQQMVDSVNAQIQDEYNQIGNLQQEANDPFLGAAERAEARKQLREMGAVGIRSAESDIDKMADEIAEANTITFMGEDKTIEEVLGDEHLEGVAALYFSDPEYAKKLKEQEPEMAAFLDKHHKIMEDAVSEVGEAAKAAAQTNQDNQDMDTYGGVALDDNLMSSLIDNWGEMSSEPYQRPPFLQAVNSMNQGKQREIVTNINNLAKDYPNITEEIKNLNSHDIRRLGLDGSNPEALNDFKQYMQTNKLIEEFNRTGWTEEGVLELVNPGGSISETKQMIQSIQKAVDNGVMDSSFDFSTDVDGNVFLGSLIDDLKNSFSGKGSIAGFGNAKVFPSTFFNEIKKEADKADSSRQAYDKAGLEFGQKIDDKTIQDMTVEEIGNFANTEEFGKLDKATQKKMAKNAEVKYMPELNQMTTELSGFKSFEDLLDNVWSGKPQTGKDAKLILAQLNDTMTTYSDENKLQRAILRKQIKKLKKVITKFDKDMAHIEEIKKLKQSDVTSGPYAPTAVDLGGPFG